MKSKEKNIQLIPSGNKKVVIILEHELTIFTIEKIKSKIIDAFHQYDFIDLNLKKVHNMDLTFVQLFYSLKVSAQKLNKKIVFKADMPDDLRSLFENSDLNKILV